MTPKLSLIIVLLISPVVFSQFEIGAVVPDIKFDAGNDRFDVTSMFHETNKMFGQNQIVPDEDHFRRTIKSNEDELNLDRLTKDKRRTVPVSTRRFIQLRNKALKKNLRWKMASANERDKRRIENFLNVLSFNTRRNQENRIENVKLNESEKRVEVPSKDNEVLMNYAMPVIMTIDGYLKVPSA